MDLIHELCPLQLLEVTKKSDILSVLLASIQHLAHIDQGPSSLVYSNKDQLFYRKDLIYNCYI